MMESLKGMFAPFAAESRESLDLSRSLEGAIRVFAEHLPAAEGEDPASGS